MTVILNRWQGKEKGFDDPWLICSQCKKPHTLKYLEFAEFEIGICKSCLCEAIAEIDRAVLEAAGGEK